MGRREGKGQIQHNIKSLHNKKHIITTEIYTFYFALNSKLKSKQKSYKQLVEFCEDIHYEQFNSKLSG